MKLFKSSQNWLSLAGITLAGISAFIIFFLFLISVLFENSSSYLGLFTFIVAPTFLVIGLILIPIGMIINIRRDKKKKSSGKEGVWPIINFNDKKHKKAALIFSGITLVFIVFSSIGSYEAFHYTESVKFCGTLCHNVMEPEFVAYQNSSHARVACVECHVGSGADWYVKSKLSGLYQVWAVLTKIFPKPIPTPITSLRPARETCEKCHWPQKFYARKLKVQKSFLADSLNTEWDVALQMKIGSTYSAMGLHEGIHWHINPDVKIEYISNTKDRESIPWVKLTNLKTGEITIYNDEENVMDKKAMDTLKVRTMDCMDCHNRPSHIYKSPPNFVDDALTAGEVPKDLPFIKYVSMKYLKEIFTNKDTAIRYIRDSISNYYKTNLPEIYKLQKNLIEKAIAGVITQFNKNEFPFMKVRWDAYPDHIGHLESDGCFRCHSNKHKSKTGKTISKNCNLCHTILAQGKKANISATNIYDNLEFKHPKDIGRDWETYFCSECHRYLY